MDRPGCYAQIDTVFPLEAETGLRAIRPDCFKCPHLRECLKDSMESQAGRELREERLEQGCGGGLLGRLRLWSERKRLEKK